MRPKTAIVSAFALCVGLGIGLGFEAVMWLINAGYRVDEEGTSPRTSELVLAWGGLAAGVFLLVIGLIGLALAAASDHQSTPHEGEGISA